MSTKSQLYLEPATAILVALSKAAVYHGYLLDVS